VESLSVSNEQQILFFASTMKINQSILWLSNVGIHLTQPLSMHMIGVHISVNEGKSLFLSSLKRRK
jgi:hypothetical protein